MLWCVTCPRPPRASKSFLHYLHCSVLISPITQDTIYYNQVLVTLHCRCLHIWVNSTRRCVQARSRVAAFRERQQQGLRRHVLLAWFSYSNLLATERKAQVRSQVSSPNMTRRFCCFDLSLCSTSSVIRLQMQKGCLNAQAAFLHLLRLQTVR